ncbi:MAG TPA: response regulator [Burkholderiales bacterium]|jgi:DNA-binding NarL/FixJ family response regulator|nr:response regulator [Burkholderiales bacterium]
MPETTRARRVAIADGSTAFLDAAATYVSTLPGFTLAGTARTEPQTVELVQSAMPDVLILDLGIGQRKGLELVRRLKATPAAPVIVALSLFYSPQALAAARRAGADELVGKERFIHGLSQAFARLFPGVA